LALFTVISITGSVTPYALFLPAGAMIFYGEELIPESQQMGIIDSATLLPLWLALLYDDFRLWL